MPEFTVERIVEGLDFPPRIRATMVQSADRPITKITPSPTANNIAQMQKDIENNTRIKKLTQVGNFDFHY